MEFTSLPIVMIENIFSYLSYEEIARQRIVCKTFNEVCMRMLNRGFLLIVKRHNASLKNVKLQLPRRESERRYHPLSRHCDILTSIETRISMLNMTYTKFIDNRMCCFIPGKVIDEIERVLEVVEGVGSPPRAHEVLQELRDISSMAIEHFDDKVAPAFRRRLLHCFGGVAPHVGHAAHAQQPETNLLQQILNVQRRTLLNSKLSLCLVNQYKKVLNKMTSYKAIAAKHRKTIKELYAKQKKQDAVMADLKRRIDECDVKYNELTHTNQAVGGKNIAASTSSEVSTSQPLRNFSSQIKLDLSVMPIGTSKNNPGKGRSNIKPRKYNIRLPSFTVDVDQPNTSQANSLANDSLATDSLANDSSANDSSANDSSAKSVSSARRKSRASPALPDYTKVFDSSAICEALMTSLIQDEEIEINQPNMRPPSPAKPKRPYDITSLLQSDSPTKKQKMN